MVVSQGGFPPLLDEANLLGINVSLTDYADVTTRVSAAAEARRRLLVTACAVHGLMTGFLDPVFGSVLNTFDIVAPDGQPIRWGVRWTRQGRLADRVYGPTLMLHVCEAAASRNLPVFLYGSRAETLHALSERLKERFPGLRIAGVQPSRFRASTAEDQALDAETILSSGARIVFVGLGCPRQEWWIFHQRNRIALPMLAVGAAFDFHAGMLPQAPAWMQRAGLEWLFRLSHEPGRLWRRYLTLNPLYLALISLQATRLRRFAPSIEIAEAETRECPG
jgi:N-acetylglucosaminyldiphosphoundecaprenol N-acetyl-beta-D-mannosaminyltransferase